MNGRSATNSVKIMQFLFIKTLFFLSILIADLDSRLEPNLECDLNAMKLGATDEVDT